MNLLSSYDQFKKTPGLSSQWSALRQSGVEYVNAKGLPTKHDEEWHYTSVKMLTEKEMSLPATVALTHEQMKTIQSWLSPEMTNLVFVNSVLNKTLSSDLPKGTSWNLKANWPEKFEDSFEALNAAYLVEGYSFEVQREAHVDKPVCFVFVNTGEAQKMTHPRLSIQVGPRSIFPMVESYISLDSGKSFTNAVVDVHVGESANVTYIRTQEESLDAVHVGRTRLHVAANAHVESLALSTGSILSRHSLRVALNGPGSNTEILGVYATSGKQHVDNTSWIEHHVGDCQTHQLYKGILDDESRAVFAGTVYIAKNAQKANSAQLNNNLILSGKAEADSKPCLNIFADDVKAAHGSTVGQLNKEELFYLQSRAISKEKAIPMLAFGFLSEVVYKISNDVLQDWLTKKLEATFAKIKVTEKVVGDLL